MCEKVLLSSISLSHCHCQMNINTQTIMMKWHLYNKELYKEIYYQGDMPNSFSEWDRVVQATSSSSSLSLSSSLSSSSLEEEEEEENCICWLSPNSFVTHGRYEMQEWLESMTKVKRNFPQCYFCVITTSRQLLYVWATTKMEAFVHCMK